MREVVLYIAMSLDGYIADVQGDVSWLCGQQAGVDDMKSYQEFIQHMDTVIMGRVTYDQLVQELSVGKWPYEDMISYVFTHRNQADSDIIKFVEGDICEFVRELKQKKGSGIWICGGASMIQDLIKEDLIDRYHIAIIPTLLGNGIRLFGKGFGIHKLSLNEIKEYNGICELIYEKREEEGI